MGGLPFVEVSHVASSASFYAAVLQPLGMHYLGDDGQLKRLLPSASSAPVIQGPVTYGAPRRGHGSDDGVPVMQVREPTHALDPLRLSTLLFAAPSRAAVAELQACATRADPDSAHVHSCRTSADGSTTRAIVRDLDGNVMEAVYPPPPGYPSASGRVGRLLEWTYNVGTRAPRQDAPPRASSRHGVEPPYPLRRSTTASTYESSKPAKPPSPQPSDSPRQSSKSSGFNTTSVLGAILGVAAGAALTYNLVSREKDRKPRQEMDDPPFLPRRSTFPEKLPSDRKSHHEDRKPAYSDYPARKLDEYPPRKLNSYSPRNPDDHVPRKLHDLPLRRLEAGKLDELPLREVDAPAPRKVSMPVNRAPRKLFSVQDNPSRRLAFRQDDLESVKGDDAYEKTHYPVQYLTECNQANRNGKSVARSTTSRASARHRTPDDTYESRSRHSSKHSRRPRSEAPASRAPSVRAYSEAPPSRTPSERARSRTRSLRARSEAPVDEEIYSARSRHSRRPSRSGRDRERDDERHAPARPHRASGSTRRPRMDEGEYEVVGQGRPGSRFGRTPSYASPRGVPLPMSIAEVDPNNVSSREMLPARSGVGRAASYYSAHEVPLPPSDFGSSEANWDDDMISLAPSDSISCVGLKKSRRSRR